jgi:hypothetical protein
MGRARGVPVTVRLQGSDIPVHAHLQELEEDANFIAKVQTSDDMVHRTAMDQISYIVCTEKIQSIYPTRDEPNPEIGHCGKAKMAQWFQARNDVAKQCGSASPDKLEFHTSHEIEQWDDYTMLR